MESNQDPQILTNRLQQELDAERSKTTALRAAVSEVIGLCKTLGPDHVGTHISSIGARLEIALRRGERSDGDVPRFHAILEAFTSDVVAAVPALKEPDSGPLAAIKLAARSKSVREALSRLTSEERLALLRDYCSSCGDAQPTDPRARLCQCWNDD